MKDVLTGSFAAREHDHRALQRMRVVNWNIERGLQLPAIVDFLESQNADPRWPPENRPYVATSKPANGAEPGQEYL